jgi:hypothetical protein
MHQTRFSTNRLVSLGNVVTLLLLRSRRSGVSQAPSVPFLGLELIHMLVSLNLQMTELKEVTPSKQRYKVKQMNLFFIEFDSRLSANAPLDCAPLPQAER